MHKSSDRGVLQTFAHFRGDAIQTAHQKVRLQDRLGGFDYAQPRRAVSRRISQEAVCAFEHSLRPQLFLRVDEGAERAALRECLAHQRDTVVGFG